MRELELSYEEFGMKNWNTPSGRKLLADTTALLRSNGWEFSWDLASDQPKFYTKSSTGYQPDWDEWDADLGEADLAFMVATVLEFPEHVS